MSGRIQVKPGSRDEPIDRSAESLRTAGPAEGHMDPAVSADPVEPDRLDGFEHWGSEQDLHVFRANGPDPGIHTRIEHAEVSRQDRDYLPLDSPFQGAKLYYRCVPFFF